MFVGIFVERKWPDFDYVVHGLLGIVPDNPAVAQDSRNQPVAHEKTVIWHHHRTVVFQPAVHQRFVSLLATAQPINPE